MPRDERGNAWHLGCSVDELEDGMIELIIVAGTLLLISAGTMRRPAPRPVRANRKR